MGDLTITIALAAGLVSFLSPCVLPIVPGFLAYLAGTATAPGGRRQFDIFLASAFFVLGFSLVFAALGVLLTTALSSVAYDVQVWLARAGGIVIILFGLYLVGVFRIPFLSREYKIPVAGRFRSRRLTSFLFGAAFAAGWTPCVGAVLGSILALAAVTPGAAFSLLLAYAFGLGVPFLLVGLFTTRADALISRYSKALRYVNLVFGVVLVVIGILAFTQNLSVLASFPLLNRFLPAL